MSVLAAPFLLIFIQCTSRDNKMPMWMLAKQTIVGVENSVGSRSPLEFLIPAGKAVNRFPG